ncbi:hypothetical protein NIES3804_37940 [Microcystis aeruginosa NIES-3804]|uniref:Secreted protein n=1 Tax=Microcystis aeruginosa NIES-3804 TaxID=2517783 RepID=A0A6H9H2S2_MICAE|nr:hypothetical protein NIES3804_37940 [Microcystis aeruginosa NIES-3804]
MFSPFFVFSIGFSGSRSPSRASELALRDLLPLVPPRCQVSVGCANGIDRLVRAYFSGSPSLLVFSVASGRFGSGRSAFARRSMACVRSVAAGDQGLLVVLPSSPVCPAGVTPSQRFFGGGSGSWGSAAFALASGRRILLWLPGSSAPPAWAGIDWTRWESCWWLGLPVPPSAQLSPF